VSASKKRARGGITKFCGRLKKRNLRTAPANVTGGGLGKERKKTHVRGDGKTFFSRVTKGGSRGTTKSKKDRNQGGGGKKKNRITGKGRYDRKTSDPHGHGRPTQPLDGPGESKPVRFTVKFWGEGNRAPKQKQSKR